MPTHFLGLEDACNLVTGQYQLSARIIDDLIEHTATGVIHGPAGVGKTFAGEANLERLRDTDARRVITCSLSFPSKPTMRRVAAELVGALTGRCRGGRRPRQPALPCGRRRTREMRRCRREGPLPVEGGPGTEPGRKGSRAPAPSGPVAPGIAVTASHSLQTSLCSWLSGFRTSSPDEFGIHAGAGPACPTQEADACCDYATGSGGSRQAVAGNRAVDGASARYSSVLPDPARIVRSENHAGTRSQRAARLGGHRRCRAANQSSRRDRSDCERQAHYGRHVEE